MSIRRDPIRERGPGGHAAAQHDEAHRERSDAETWDEALLACERAAAIVVGYADLGLVDMPWARYLKIGESLAKAYDTYEEKPNEIETAESQLSVNKDSDSGWGEVGKPNS